MMRRFKSANVFMMFKSLNNFTIDLQFAQWSDKNRTVRHSNSRKIERMGRAHQNDPLYTLVPPTRKSATRNLPRINIPSVRRDDRLGNFLPALRIQLPRAIGNVRINDPRQKGG